MVLQWSLIMNSDKNAYVYVLKRNKEVLYTKAHDAKRLWMKVENFN